MSLTIPYQNSEMDKAKKNVNEKKVQVGLYPRIAKFGEVNDQAAHPDNQSK